MATSLSLSFAALTIDCADPAALADFWGEALAALAGGVMPTPTLTSDRATACRRFAAARK